MFFSIFPMLLVPEGGIHEEIKNPSIQETGVVTASGKVFILFITAMAFINFGRNSIAVIQSHYLVLESSFAVSSKVLSYIVNTQSIAMIITGFAAGWIGKKIGNGNSLLFGTVMAIGSLILLATTDSLTIIYLSNFLRGCSEVIILASSYSLASVLIPPEKRGKLFSI